MDSSTRAWIVTDLCCLGGALMIAICPFCSSLVILYYELSYNSVAAPYSRGQNTSCDFQQQEVGATPEARRDRAAISRHRGVAPASDRVLAALRSLALFRAFACSFCL